MSSIDISILLRQAQDGSEDARASLFTRLHKQLRQHAQFLMKGERPDHTLQASALVNEACLKLIKEGTVESAANRRQLFHSAIRAMREVLIDHARARQTKKRGGDLQKQAIDLVLDQFESKHELSFLDLEDALVRLQSEAPRAYEAINLRFFGGLTVAEAADLLGCSRQTVEADWRFARAKLTIWLRGIGTDDPQSETE